MGDNEKQADKFDARHLLYRGNAIRPIGLCPIGCELLVRHFILKKLPENHHHLRDAAYIADSKVGRLHFDRNPTWDFPTRSCSVDLQSNVLLRLPNDVWASRNSTRIWFLHPKTRLRLPSGPASRNGQGRAGQGSFCIGASGRCMGAHESRIRCLPGRDS